MNIALLLCFLPTQAPPTPEQIAGWVKKLEEPTGLQRDPTPGPPDGPAPRFNYRFHWGEITSLKRAGDAAQPAVLALLADTTKPGQARGQAATILVEWLHGRGAKQELNPKVLAALKEALKDKDAALKWGLLHSVNLYGKASAYEWFMKVAKSAPTLQRDSMHLSDAAMDGLLPEIIACLRDAEPEVAAEAAETIYSFGQPKQGVKELIAALERKEVSVRATAAAALGRVGQEDPAALKAVLGQLKPDLYGDSYSSVLYAVGCFGPKAKDAVPALIEAVKDDRWKKEAPYMYNTAIVALGKIGSDAKLAVPAVLARMSDAIMGNSHPEIVQALDKIGIEAGKEARAVKKRLEDEFRDFVERSKGSGPPPSDPILPPLPM